MSAERMTAERAAMGMTLADCVRALRFNMALPDGRDVVVREHLEIVLDAADRLAEVEREREELRHRLDGAVEALTEIDGMTAWPARTQGQIGARARTAIAAATGAEGRKENHG